MTKLEELVYDFEQACFAAAHDCAGSLEKDELSQAKSSLLSALFISEQISGEAGCDCGSTEPFQVHSWRCASRNPSPTDIDCTSDPKGHWQDGGKVWVEDHDCSLPEGEQIGGEDALAYATRLVTLMAEKHYHDVSPDWEPLPDIVGVLTQIDNMVSGMVRALTSEQISGEAVEPGWQPISTAPTDNTEFLAYLTNGWIVIMNGAFDGTARYEWWHVSGNLSIPYEPSHPKGSLVDSMRATHWHPLPTPPEPKP